MCLIRAKDLRLKRVDFNYNIKQVKIITMSEGKMESVKSKPKVRRMIHSSRTIRGRLERFLKRQLTAQKLGEMYDSLTAKEKLAFLTEVLPYVLAKPSAGQDMDLDRLTDEQVDALYSRVMKAAV